MAEELALIHGLPVDCSEELRLRELQNALLWINFRYYLAPLFWFVVFGPYGPIALAGICLPARLSNLAGAPQYAAGAFAVGYRSSAELAGLDPGAFGWGGLRAVRPRRACAAGLVRLAGDRHSSSYQVLTRLAQFSLARDPHMDPVQTPRAAVTLARKVTMIIVVVVALLTIYGTLL